MLSVSIVTIQWMLFGFSLSFSESGSSFIGNFKHGGMTHIGLKALELTAPSVPSIAFALYQLQFACLTPALIFGSVAERIRIAPALLFVLLWTTFVYDFAAYWTWGARGFLKNLSCLSTISSSSSQTPCMVGSIDFAGMLEFMAN
jgi:Amt family ammonium transporter